jgi:hypothetical protein
MIEHIWIPIHDGERLFFFLLLLLLLLLHSVLITIGGDVTAAVA